MPPSWTRHRRAPASSTSYNDVRQSREAPSDDRWRLVAGVTSRRPVAAAAAAIGQIWSIFYWQTRPVGEARSVELRTTRSRVDTRREWFTRPVATGMLLHALASCYRHFTHRNDGTNTTQYDTISRCNLMCTLKLTSSRLSLLRDINNEKYNLKTTDEWNKSQKQSSKQPF